jgi:hypothetical protein
MKNDGVNPDLKNAFNDLQNVPPRDLQAASRGKANFLQQAAVYRQSVSRKADQRRNRWSSTIFPLFQRKERLPVLNTLIAVVLAIAVFFGGAGVTVYAAQDSLPDQALYPVKTWSEDAILSLTGSALMGLNYALDFSDRRVAEMADLLAAGKPIPEGVEARLQNELDLTLELAAGLDDPQALQQMVQIRQRAENQMETMTRLISGAPGSEEPLLMRTQARLQEQIQLATMGEMDLQGFRIQIRQRIQNRGGSGEPTPGSGNNPQGPGPMKPTDMPGPSGSGNGPGPMNPTNMPAPTGTSNGPGPGGNQPTGDPGPISLSKTPVPTGIPGHNGPGSQTPDRTPKPGGGSGYGP